MKNRYLSSTVIGLLSAVVIATAFHFGLLEILEFKTLDHRFRHMPHRRSENGGQRSEAVGQQTNDQTTNDQPTSDQQTKSPADIAIVVIDQSSIELVYRNLGQRWPWPREFYAKMLGFLKQAGAKAVVFDMFFSEPDINRGDISGENSDAALVAATHYVTNVFHTYILQQIGLPAKSDRQDAIKQKSAFPSTVSNKNLCLRNYRTGALPSAELTAAAAGIGFATIRPERDNICRRILLAAAYTNTTVMSQSLAAGYVLLGKPEMNLTYNSLQIGDKYIQTDRSASAFLWWYRPPKGKQSPYPHYSAFNILRAGVLLENGRSPEMDLSDFKDKIIYIGSTAPGLFDAKATPLAGGIPGVEVQATALANLLNNDYVSRLPQTTIYITIFILCLITALTTGGMHRHSSGMLIPLVLLGGVIAAGYGALAYRHIFIDIVPPSFSIVLTFGITTITNYLTERRHSRMVRGIFEHYLDSSVVNNLIANPDQVRLGGELRKCTVLFTDVANFTNTSEQLGPEQVVHFMNIYLNAMTDIIIEEGGFVDKFIGDEIIAIFGAPNILPDHAERACRATLRMRDKVKELQPEFRKAGCKTEIFARTGMCTGDVVIGNMGSDTRMNYTAMGNTMNLGARIEGINKVYGTRIMVNETTAKESGMVLREIDTVQVKGKEKGERIFELIGYADDTDIPKNTIDEFQTALELFRNQNWSKAGEIFNKLAEKGDVPSQVFAKRCNEYRKNPPPQDWNGIYVMQTK